jgi:hypothetical protein
MLSDEELDKAIADRERARAEAIEAANREAANRARAAARDHALLALASLDREIAEATRWRDEFLPTARKTLCDELLLPRGRTRAEQDMQANLRLSIHSIDFGLKSLYHGSAFTLRSTRLGELMIAAGYVPTDGPNNQQFGGLPWRGSLPEVEQYLKDLTSRRAVAQQQLVLASRSPEETAAAAARPVRKTRGDGTQYDKYPDGVCVEIPVEQSATGPSETSTP